MKILGVLLLIVFVPLTVVLLIVFCCVCLAAFGCWRERQ